MHWWVGQRRVKVWVDGVDGWVKGGLMGLMGLMGGSRVG